MWSSRCASVGVVTKLVYVHTTLGIGIVSGDVVRDGGWGRLGGLLESDRALHVRVTTEVCDYDRVSIVLEAGQGTK